MRANGKTSVLLAVDPGTHEPMAGIHGAIDMARQLVRGYADRVVVLHVREFSVARLSAMMAEHGGADGQRMVDQIVAVLRDAGVNAEGVVREADGGHVAATILRAADEFGASAIVLSSPKRRVPVGSVAQHLMRAGDVPVVIVRRAALTRDPELALAGRSQ